MSPGYIKRCQPLWQTQGGRTKWLTRHRQYTVKPHPMHAYSTVLIRFQIYQRIIVYITNGNSNIISNVIATQYTLKTVIEV